MQLQSKCRGVRVETNAGSQNTKTTLPPIQQTKYISFSGVYLLIIAFTFNRYSFIQNLIISDHKLDFVFNLKLQNDERPVFIISHLSFGQLEAFYTTVAHSPSHTHIHTPVAEHRELGCGVPLTDASAV